MRCLIVLFLLPFLGFGQNDSISGSTSDQKIIQNFNNPILSGWSAFWKNRLLTENEILSVQPTAELFNNCYESVVYCNEPGSWEEIGPITSSSNNTADVGRLSCIEIDPLNDSIILAGSPSGGLYYTLDKGNSWINAGLDRPFEVHGIEMFTPGIASIVIIHENDMTFWFVATGDKDHNFSFSRGILRSTDFGNSWNLINGSQPDNLPDNWYYIRKLIQHPDNSNTLFAATSQGIFKTMNALTENPDSIIWTNILEDSISNGEGYFDLEFHKTQSNIMITSKEYRELNSITGDEILISYDTGESWTPFPGIIDVLPVGKEFSFFLSLLELTPANTDILHVYLKGKKTTNDTSIYFNDHWKYNFSNNEWNHLNPIPFTTGNGRNGFAISPVNDSLLYCATVNTYVSANGGNSWLFDNDSINQYDGTKFCPHIDIQDLKFNKNGTELWAASDGGPYLKVLADTIWRNKVNNIGIAKALKFDHSTLDPDFYLFGGWDVGSQLFNKAENLWTQKGEFPSDGYGCAFDPNESGTFYTAQYVYDHNEIYSYQNLVEPISTSIGNFWNANMLVNPEFPGNVYLSLGDKIMQSKDQGLSWETLVQPEDLGLNPEDYLMWDMHVAEGNGSYLYLRIININNGLHPFIFKSININNEPFSIDWSDITPYSANFTWINDLEVDPVNPEKLWAAFYTSEGSVIMEYDGTAWTDITDNLSFCKPGILSLACLKGTNGGLFAGSYYGILFREDSTNGWQFYKHGLPNVAPVDLKINYTSVKIVTATDGRGIWETELPASYWIHEYGINASGKLIIQPNPANKQFELWSDCMESNEEKTIKIFNSSGNLMIEIRTKSAVNPILINCTNWPKGLFLAILYQEGEVVDWGKVILN